MDILNLLSSYLSNGNLQKLSPLVNLLARNSFDIKKTISSLSLEDIAPLLGAFINQNDNSPREVREENISPKTEPIKTCASFEIVDRLNRYFETI